MAAARSTMVACAPEALARGVAPGLGLEVIKLPVAVPPEQVVQAWHPRVDADAAHQCLRRCIGTLSSRNLYSPFRGRNALGPTRHQALLALGTRASRL
jgi:DNA-binding transcriptional LysR family regulator